MTNDTAAFGVYSSQEKKQTRVELEFDAEGSVTPVAGACAAWYTHLVASA